MAQITDSGYSQILVINVNIYIPVSVKYAKENLGCIFPVWNERVGRIAYAYTLDSQCA